MRRITLLLVVFLAIPAFSQTKLTGAGATFPTRFIRNGSANMARRIRMCRSNYQSIGSGGGIRQVSEGTVDFGAATGPCRMSS